MGSITRNYIYHLLYQFVALLIPLITTPHIAKTLGVENVGIYSYVTTIVQYFVIFSQIGLNLYGKREISYVRNERDRLTCVFWQLFFLRFLLFLLGAGLYILLILNANEYKKYYTIMLLVLISGLLDITWLYQGMEKFKKVSVLNIIIRILHTFFILAMIKNKEDLEKYFLVYGISELLLQSCLWFGLRKIIAGIPLCKVVCVKEMVKHLKGSAVTFMPQIFITIYTMLDKLVLGTFSTPKQVGLYTESEKIVKLSLAVITSVGIVVMPRVANYYTDGKKDEEVLSLLRNTKRLVWFMAFPMIGGLIGISGHFVSWFLGPGYEMVEILVVIISPIILFIGLSDLYGMQYLIPYDHMKEYILSTAVGSIANVFFNILMVRKLGAIGVSIATVISEFIVTLMMYRYAKRYINIRSESCWKYIFSAFIMMLVVKCVDCWSPIGIIYTVSEIIIGIAIYFLILLLLRDVFLYSTLKKFKRQKEVPGKRH